LRCGCSSPVVHGKMYFQTLPRVTK
jgi:hypothetical protein